MQKSRHHTIFYPSDPSLLALQSAKEEPKKSNVEILTLLPSAILVPHAGYPYILEALHKSFSSITTLKPKLVVILAPLHQEALDVDKPHFLFVPSGRGLELPHTEVAYAQEMRSTLLSLFGDIIKEEDSYFVEEAAVELTLPLVASYAPGVEVLPLLTATGDAKECKLYATILDKIVALVPETLFVVSANLSAVLPSSLATEHARALVKLLEGGEPLLESVRSHQVSSCGVAAFEALRHQKWGSNGWVFSLFSAEGETFPHLPQEYITKERIVWHASAKRKEV